MISQRCKRGACAGAVAALALALAFALVVAPSSALADDADAAADDAVVEAAEAVTEGEFLVTIETAGAFAYYSFTAPEDGYYTFSTLGDSDTYAYLYDADWNLVAEDDDSGTDYNACVTVALAAGEVCYVAFGYYSVEMTGSYVVELECAALGTLVAGEVAESGVTEGGQSVYFTIAPDETGLYAISTTGDCDTYAYLYDAEWNLVASDDDSGADYNAQVVAQLEAGQTYYFAVCLYYSDEIGDFSVVMEALQAETLAVGEEATAALGEGESVYYLFTAEELGVFTFASTGDGDTYAYVYDLQGVLLGSDDDSGEGTNAQVSVALAAGETCIVQFLFYFEDDAGEFAVTVDEAAVTELDTTTENAAVVDGSGDVTYFAFTPEETGMYSFTLAAVEGYVAMSVYDSSWEELVELTLGEVEYDYDWDDLDWLLELLGDDEEDFEDDAEDEGEDEDDGSGVEIEPLTASLTLVEETADAADDDVAEVTTSTTTLVLQAGETYVIALSYDEDDVPQSLAVSVASYEIEACDTASELAIQLGDMLDCELYAFTPDETALYTFATAGDADAMLYLYDADWNEVAYDDDGGEDYNASLSVVLEAGQTYYLECTLSYYDDVTDYTVTIEQSEALALDASAENAAVIDGSGAATYYTYTAEETAPVVLTLSGAGEEAFDGYLYVYNSAGEQVSASYISVSAGEEASAEVIAMFEAGEGYVIELSYADGTPTSLAVELAAVEVVDVSEEAYALSFDSAVGEVAVYLSYTAEAAGAYDFLLSGTADGELYAYVYVGNAEWDYLSYALIDIVDGEGGSAMSATEVVLAEGETCLIELYVYSFDDATADLQFTVEATDIGDVAEAIAAGVPDDFAVDDADADEGDAAEDEGVAIEEVVE